MSRRSICWLFTCSALLLAGGTAVNADRLAADEAPSPPKVLVHQPLAREVTDHEDFTGRTEAAEVVQIRSRVAGQLDKVFFQAGAAVKSGERLFQIDARPFQAELDRAEAEVRLAETRLKRRNAERERAQALLNKEGITRGDFERVAAEQAEAEAAVQVARSSRDLARLNLGYTRITPPISGKIGRPLLTAGNFVKVGDTLLATIVSTGPLHVSFDVDERTLLHLRRTAREGKFRIVGAAVRMGVASTEGFPYRGEIDFADNQVDPATGTLRLRAVFPNREGALMPGMFARIRLTTSEPYRALLVPEQAVLSAAGEKFILVVNEKNVVEHRPVKLGRLHGNMRVVKEGLAAGDWIIVGGLKGVRPGQTVDPQRVALPAPPPDSRDKPGPNEFAAPKQP